MGDGTRIDTYRTSAELPTHSIEADVPNASVASNARCPLGRWDGSAEVQNGSNATVFGSGSCRLVTYGSRGRHRQPAEPGALAEGEGVTARSWRRPLACQRVRQHPERGDLQIGSQ